MTTDKLCLLTGDRNEWGNDTLYTLYTYNRRTFPHIDRYGWKDIKEKESVPHLQRLWDAHHVHLTLQRQQEKALNRSTYKPTQEQVGHVFFEIPWKLFVAFKFPNGSKPDS